MGLAFHDVTCQNKKQKYHIQMESGFEWSSILFSPVTRPAQRQGI